MKLQLVLLIMSLFSFHSGQALELGEPAPTPTALDQDGQPLAFADVYKKGVTVVYFYPKADTPGCTAQACSLRDSHADLQAKGVQIIGVSGDKPDAQKAFQAKYTLPFPLIADTDGAVAKAFGVPITGGFAKRQAFMVKDGKIVWRDLKAATKNQAADIHAALETLGS